MTFTEWQLLARNLNDRAERIRKMRRERASKLAESYGLPMDLCCLHNASIATPRKGWGNPPENIKNARRVLRIIDDWTAYRIAERIIDRAWQKVRR